MARAVNLFVDVPLVVPAGRPADRPIYVLRQLAVENGGRAGTARNDDGDISFHERIFFSARDSS